MRNRWVTAGNATDTKYGFGISQFTVQGTPMLDQGGGIFGFSSPELAPERPGP